MPPPAAAASVLVSRTAREFPSSRDVAPAERPRALSRHKPPRPRRMRDLLRRPKDAARSSVVAKDPTRARRAVTCGHRRTPRHHDRCHPGAQSSQRTRPRQMWDLCGDRRTPHPAQSSQRARPKPAAGAFATTERCRTTATDAARSSVVTNHPDRARCGTFATTEGCRKGASARRATPGVRPAQRARPGAAPELSRRKGPDPRPPRGHLRQPNDAAPPRPMPPAFSRRKGPLPSTPCGHVRPPKDAAAAAAAAAIRRAPPRGSVVAKGPT